MGGLAIIDKKWFLAVSSVVIFPIGLMHDHNELACLLMTADHHVNAHGQLQNVYKRLVYEPEAILTASAFRSEWCCRHFSM